MFEFLCTAGIFLLSRKAIQKLTEDFAIVEVISLIEPSVGYGFIYTNQGFFYSKSTKFDAILLTPGTYKIVFQGFYDRYIVDVQPINIGSKSSLEPVEVGSN